MFTTALPNAQVVDGPPTVDVSGDVVAVGLAPQEPADVDTTEDIAGLGVVDESFPVLCVARSWSGDDSVKAQRDRTYALISACKTALKADSTLGGVVTLARFAGSSYQPWRHQNGFLVVDVTFQVAVQSLA